MILIFVCGPQASGKSKLIDTIMRRYPKLRFHEYYEGDLSKLRERIHRQEVMCVVDDGVRNEVSTTYPRFDVIFRVFPKPLNELEVAEAHKSGMFDKVLTVDFTGAEYAGNRDEHLKRRNQVLGEVDSIFNH